MKVRVSLIAAVMVALTVLGAGLIAQSSDTEAQDALREYLEQLAVTGIVPPDVESSDWKVISQDFGLRLREDSEGVLRGRLYVRRDGTWSPVAVDGLVEVAPQDLLLQRPGPQ